MPFTLFLCARIFFNAELDNMQKPHVGPSNLCRTEGIRAEIQKIIQTLRKGALEAVVSDVPIEGSSICSLSLSSGSFLLLMTFPSLASISFRTIGSKTAVNSKCLKKLLWFFAAT